MGNAVLFIVVFIFSTYDCNCGRYKYSPLYQAVKHGKLCHEDTRGCFRNKFSKPASGTWSLDIPSRILKAIYPSPVNCCPLGTSHPRCPHFSTPDPPQLHPWPWKFHLGTSLANPVDFRSPKSSLSTISSSPQSPPWHRCIWSLELQSSCANVSET